VEVTVKQLGSLQHGSFATKPDLYDKESGVDMLLLIVLLSFKRIIRYTGYTSWNYIGVLSINSRCKPLRTLQQ
jgi:hypothetical protein